MAHLLELLLIIAFGFCALHILKKEKGFLSRMHKNMEYMFDRQKKMEITVNSSAENSSVHDTFAATSLLIQIGNKELLVGRMEKEEKEAVCSLVESMHPHSIDYLSNTYASLTTDDLMLISLWKLGFTTEDLVFAFEYSDVRSLYRRKSRLKEKLSLSKEESLDDFLRNLGRQTNTSSTKDGR
ncbi:MAG: hypothetical protein LBN29_10295 [Mediterranea sp.]|jgi:hypothetical protein|nr:hypothetical protein [Mediterranea sp.]